MKKVLSLFLTIILCLTMILPMSAAENDTMFEEREVALYSSFTDSKGNETLLLYGDIVYMKLDSILEYTGYSCEYSPEDPILHLERSGKRITVDKEKGKLHYWGKAIDIPDILDYQESIWIPLHPTLLYLNARCDFADGYLVILTAESTIHEYIHKFYEMIESQLCTIQWADNEDKWYYDAVVVMTSILDVFFNDKIGIVLNKQYEKERCKSILLNIMGEIDEETFDEYAMKYYPEIVKKTKWYKELDKYSKADVDKVLNTIELADYAGDVMELVEYVDKVYNMQEFHIEMVDQVLLKGSRFFGNSFRDKEMYKAAKEMITLYKKERTPFKEVVNFAIEYYIDYRIDEHIYDHLLKPGHALAVIGMKLFAAAMGYNDDYDDFLTLNSMYQLQKELENAFCAAIEDAENHSALSTDHVDFLYDCALLYIQVRRAADNILGINAGKVEEMYHAFLSVDRETLYFDDPNYLSDNLITSDVISSLPGVGTEDGWAGRYVQYFSAWYGNHTSIPNLYTKEEYIPFVELYADGTYKLGLNMLEGMLFVTGEWQIEPENKNMVRLLRPDPELNYGEVDSDVLFVRISESEIVMLEPDSIMGTSIAGDIYSKMEETSDSSAENKQKHWYQLYLELIASADAMGDKLVLDEYLIGLGNAWLYDINSDSIPELILGDRYNDTCYLYTVQDNKCTFVVDLYNIVDVTVREDVKTGQRHVFISTSVNGAHSIQRVDMDEKNTASVKELITIVHDPIAENMVEIHYYVDGEETDKETYENALSDYENTCKIVETVHPYAINVSSIWNRATYELGKNMIKYIAKNQN